MVLLCVTTTQIEYVNGVFEHKSLQSRASRTIRSGKPAQR